jgi:hypothetical protein
MDITTTLNHQVSLSQIMNGIDVNVHFSSMPVMVWSNNRFVPKFNPNAYQHHTVLHQFTPSSIEASSYD